MIKEIQAKVLLAHITHPDDIFGLKYNLNIYRGCQHQCIYCDSRSECYQIENFNDILVKVNAVDLLRQELPHKRVKGTIGFGSMSDPYIPLEARLNLTGQALQVIASFGFPVHLITKSSLVLKDLETLVEINRTYAAVSFTITTTDDSLAKLIEPGAPSPTERLHAMSVLAGRGIVTGVTMMPVLPFIEDNEENIRQIILKAHASGAAYIIPWFGMSLRDRQRSYYYEKLDRHFPGLRQQYERRYGEQYSAPAQNARQLEKIFTELCQELHLPAEMPKFTPEKIEKPRKNKQLSFL